MVSYGKSGLSHTRTAFDKYVLQNVLISIKMLLSGWIGCLPETWSDLQAKKLHTSWPLSAWSGKRGINILNIPLENSHDDSGSYKLKWVVQL